MTTTVRNLSARMNAEAFISHRNCAFQAPFTGCLPLRNNAKNPQGNPCGECAVYGIYTATRKTAFRFKPRQDRRHLGHSDSSYYRNGGFLRALSILQCKKPQGILPAVQHYEQLRLLILQSHCSLLFRTGGDIYNLSNSIQLHHSYRLLLKFNWIILVIESLCQP